MTIVDNHGSRTLDPTTKTEYTGVAGPAKAGLAESGLPVRQAGLTAGRVGPAMRDRPV